MDTLLSYFMLNDISYSNTSDASYDQLQVIITLEQIGIQSSSNTAGISSGVQFTIGGGSGEQSVSKYNWWWIGIVIEY